MSDQPQPTFDDLRQLLAELPDADAEAAARAAEREQRLVKPAGSLGRLEELVAWLAAWQRRHPPRIDRPRLAVFAGNHGVVRHGVSAYPAEVTAQMVKGFVDGRAAINQLSRHIDADLRIYEMALERPTADFTEGWALSEADCALAVAYGMMAVEPGIDLLCLGAMGIGNTTAAAALCLGLFGGTAADWTGRGTGIDDTVLARKIEVVARAGDRHASKTRDPFELLARLGGRELAAIAGAVLAARVAGVPVLLDGFVASAASAVLECAMPGALDHCQMAHLSTEPGHRRLLDRLGKRPLLDLDMRLGEATGAAIAVPVLRAALACHVGMASFEEAGVSGPAS